VRPPRSNLDFIHDLATSFAAFSLSNLNDQTVQLRLIESSVNRGFLGVLVVMFLKLHHQAAENTKPAGCDLRLRT
jgi:hypothetical protein